MNKSATADHSPQHRQTDFQLDLLMMLPQKVAPAKNVQWRMTEEDTTGTVTPLPTPVTTTPTTLLCTPSQKELFLLQAAFVDHFVPATQKILMKAPPQKTVLTFLGAETYSLKQCPQSDSAQRDGRGKALCGSQDVKTH